MDKIAEFKLKIAMIKNEGLIKESELDQEALISSRNNHLEAESPTYRKKRTLVK